MRFPDVPTYGGFQAPCRFEGEIRNIEVVQGEVPNDLNGTFFRAGPDPQFPPLLGDDNFLNGDGMIAAFRFESGEVDFHCRWVRTPKFEAERQAGRALFGAYRNPFTDDPRARGISGGTANTNVLWHGGRLMALKEDSHPIELDPWSLETVGQFDFEGQLTSATATAHPKIDPDSGALVFFGYEARGIATPDIAYYEADAEGQIVFERWITAPYASMVHDFAVTANYVVFPIVPLTSDLQRMKDGFPHFSWDPALPMYLGVLPRRDPHAPVRWFRGDARFASHTMNAFERDGCIHLDTSVSDSVVFPFFPDITGAPYSPEAATPYPSRWCVDLRGHSDEIKQTRLTEMSGEFPRINESYATKEYRFGYLLLQGPTPDEMPGSATGMRFNLIGRVDHQTGTVAVHDVGPASASQEPVFVPRPGADGEAAGYLVSLVNRYSEMRSDLLILDAENIDAAPIATLALPLRLRNGLHGTWVEHQALESPVRHREAPN